MATNPDIADSLKARRLIYVDDSLPGITRRRAGRGWSYRDPLGCRIEDKAERKRLDAIALPPAYRDAWFCPAANGHILATGFDDKDRKQYRYHPAFREMREAEKFDSMLGFGKLLPLVRKRVEEDLRARKITQVRAVASVVRLLDTGLIRVGNERYTAQNGSFGASTLRMRHAEFEGRSLRLRFKAKSGKQRDVRVADAALARFVKAMQDLPGQHLFQYLDEDGDPCPIGSGDVNAYLRETMGESFSAKHFRTWHASQIALRELAEARTVLTIKAVMETVSEQLGNTPTIARNSYVHPIVTGLIESQEEWRAGLKLPRTTKWHSRHERALIALLESRAV